MDALFDDVRRLVEAAKAVDAWWWEEVLRNSDCPDKQDILTAIGNLQQAIASVERHLEEGDGLANG